MKVFKRTQNFSDTRAEIYVASAERGNVILAKKFSEYAARYTGPQPVQGHMNLFFVVNLMIKLMSGVGIDNVTFTASESKDTSGNSDDDGNNQF